MTEIRVLHRLMFSEVEAAHLLRVPQSTLHWWLDGATISGRRYPPVIRVEPTGSREVTWGEFVEAGLLRQYRRELSVSLPELRVFIDEMRKRFGDAYPLATRRPYVGEGPRLVQEAQEETNLDGTLRLITPIGGQLVWLPPADSFIRRVEWNGDVAGSWRPHDDPASPVRMDPDRRFGRPAVGGVSTVVLWEQIAAGADFDETAKLFDLSVDDVEWAWAYERSARDQQSQAA